MDKIYEIREKTERFSEKIAKEFYLHGAGLKSQLELSGIYSNYSDLFTSSNLQYIKEIMDSANSDGEEFRKLKFFIEAFYTEMLGSKVRDLVSEYFSVESAGKVCIGLGNKIPYRTSVVRMLNEKSRVKREELRYSIDRFTDRKLNPILAKMFAAEKEFVNEMGFPDKVEMFNVLSGIDLYKLDNMMQQFLDETRDIYEFALKRIAKEKLGLSPENLKRHDLMHVMRASEFDGLFPAQDMIRKITDFTGTMGIDIRAENNITFDIDIRENKSPRAFCSPVKIPDEVYLVIYPRGGADDYTAFLHELGHALHFANVEESLDFEYKYYGDNSVTEGFAMTFDHLTMNEEWTKPVLGFDSACNPEYFEHKMFFELLMLRRHAAKLHYEIKLHKESSLLDKKELYSSIFRDATLVEYSPENYLTDVDANFYCARYLRAWMMQAGVTENMKRSFDCNWFSKPEAGNFLKELWSTGQKYDANELLINQGWNSLSLEPLKENIFSKLG